MRVNAPTEWVKTVSQLKLPNCMDRHVRELMDTGKEDQLTVDEREELKSLVDWTARLSLIRDEARQLLRSAGIQGHA